MPAALSSANFFILSIGDEVSIDLDGASKGMGILHLLGEISDWKQIRFGMKVAAVWKPSSERTGAITDIKYFRPIKEG